MPVLVLVLVLMLSLLLSRLSQTLVVSRLPLPAQVSFAASSAETIHNRLRGFAGWPGVWSIFSVGGGPSQRIKLLTTRVVTPVDLPESFRGTKGDPLPVLSILLEGPRNHGHDCALVSSPF